MTIHGCARVSTDGQTLANQDAQLTAAGCSKILSEKMSGAKTDRAELSKVLKRLQAVAKRGRRRRMKRKGKS